TLEWTDHTSRRRWPFESCLSFCEPNCSGVRQAIRLAESEWHWDLRSPDVYGTLGPSLSQNGIGTSLGRSFLGQPPGFSRYGGLYSVGIGTQASMSLFPHAAGIVKRLTLGRDIIPQQHILGMRDPQDEISVKLYGLDEPRDVTNQHTLASATPFS